MRQEAQALEARPKAVQYHEGNRALDLEPGLTEAEG
jgi:hypothetical protein